MFRAIVGIIGINVSFNYLILSLLYFLLISKLYLYQCIKKLIIFYTNINYNNKIIKLMRRFFIYSFLWLFYLNSPSVLGSAVIKEGTDFASSLRSMICKASLKSCLFSCSSNFTLLSLDTSNLYLGKNGIEKLLPETAPI